MGVGRRAMVYLGLAEEDEGYIDDEYEVEEPARERISRRVESRELETAPPRRFTETRTIGRVADGPRVVHQPVPEAVPQKITTLQPSSYNEARQIGEAFRDGIPVIMNLTDMVDGDAKRLVDFAAGLIFGLRGSIEKVTNKVFLLSPSNVEVSAEDKARIAGSGFYNQS